MKIDPVLWLEADPSREALVEAIHAHAESNGFLANMREAIARWKTLTPGQEAKAWEILDRMAEEKDAPKTPTPEGGWWMGTPGEKMHARVTLKVAFTKPTEFRGMQSTMYVYQFLTDQGHLIVYRGQKQYIKGGNALKVGDMVELSGTVKRAETYKDMPQTVIARPKFYKLGGA